MAVLSILSPLSKTLSKTLSIADCFALASAIEHKAVIVTGELEFKKVRHLVNIVWV